MKHRRRCPFCARRDKLSCVMMRGHFNADRKDFAFAVTCADCGCQGPAAPTEVEADRLWEEREPQGLN